MDEHKKLNLKDKKNFIIKNNDITIKKNINFNSLNKNLNNINTMRIYYFDWLRIISSISVIFIHVSCDYYMKLSINSYEWKLSYYYNGLSRWGVPIFFMISGTLFLHKELSFSIIFNKYIKRLFISFIFWSFIYYLINFKFTNINIKKIIFILFRILMGRLFLWYIYASIGLYILVPFIELICKNDKIFKKFLIICFIYSFLIPNLLRGFNYFSKDIFSILNYISMNLNINYLRGNIFYFLLGYYLNEKILLTFKIRLIIYSLGGISIIFTTVISYKISKFYNKKIDFFNNDNLNVLLTALSIFIFFKNNFNNLEINKKPHNIIKKISKNTFGIYLIHIIILEKVIPKIKNKLLLIKLIYRIPLTSFLVFIISLFICTIIRIIPIIGNFLI